MKRLIAALLLVCSAFMINGCGFAVFSKTHDRNMRQVSMITFSDQSERENRYLFALFDGNIGANQSDDTESLSLLTLYSYTVDHKD